MSYGETLCCKLFNDGIRVPGKILIAIGIMSIIVTMGGWGVMTNHHSIKTQGQNTLGTGDESGFFIKQSYRISLPHTVPGFANVQKGELNGQETSKEPPPQQTIQPRWHTGPLFSQGFQPVTRLPFTLGDLWVVITPQPVTSSYHADCTKSD